MIEIFQYTNMMLLLYSRVHGIVNYNNNSSILGITFVKPDLNTLVLRTTYWANIWKKRSCKFNKAYSKGIHVLACKLFLPEMFVTVYRISIIIEQNLIKNFKQNYNEKVTTRF